MSELAETIVGWPVQWWQFGVTRQLLLEQWQHLNVFVLVLARLSGLVLIGPLLGHRLIPRHVRLLGVICCAVLLTPPLTHQAGGRPLLPAEALEALQQFTHASLSQPAGTHTPGIPQALPLISWLPELAISVVHEVMLGLALGLGSCTLLAGVQLAGELIDQQSGSTLGTRAPAGVSGAGSQQLLFGLTVLVLLTTEAHLDLMAVLLDSFQAVPLGGFRVTRPVVDELTQLVAQSFALALQLALPTVAMMSLLALALGFLGQTVPQVNVFSVGLPLRALAHVFVLLLTLPALRDNVLGRMPRMIDQLQTLLLSSTLTP